MKCPFCDDKKITEWDGEIAEHLIATKDSVNHIHVHGPLDKKKQIHEFTETIYNHAGIVFPTATSQTPPKEIIFKNRQAIGDILVMTCAVRDFKQTFPKTRIGVATTAMHIWDNNPYIDHSFRDENAILEVGPGTLTNMSNRDNRHHCNSFRVDVENKLGLRIPQGDVRPDIWMTREEYERPPLIDGSYWVLVIGGEPGWTAKMYPADRWQEVIDSLPDIQFVQLGIARHPFPHLKNCVDFIGRTESKDTGIRDLFNIFLHAQGSVGLVSMHMHLSGAFNNPCIVVAGAREPAWFTHYFGHQYIETNGCVLCAESKACWKCAIEACADSHAGIPKCVDIIHPKQIVDGIRKYYKGGRLQYGKKIKNDFFKNIVEEKKTHAVPKPSGLPTKYGMEWGGGGITDKDWELFKKVIRENNVKTVLEFGVGLSSLLLMNEVDKVVSYESQGGWIEKIRAMANDRLEVRYWDGKILKEELPKFDMTFVDGPAGGINREASTKIASEHSDIVIIHDAGREWERKWQDKYIKNKFPTMHKGGHRCHLWTKKKRTAIENPDVRFVSTARGWGGCARSITTIMRFLLEKGHSVEFVSFHRQFEQAGGICGEFQNYIDTYLKGLAIGNYNSIPEPCKTLFVYADDYIWNFNRPDLIKLFSNLQCERKVMMLNYRRGNVGEIGWTKDWNKYMFLNSTQEAELLKVLPSVKTKVLPPCTVLDEFLKVKPNYDGMLRLVRHSSQGDVKFDKNSFPQEVSAILESRPDVEIHLMPGPSFVNGGKRVYKYPRNITPIPSFLSKGNLFWYSLPKGYFDMGPRVILEAMSAGLPVIADNWGGAKDRVIPETGWLCDTKEQFVDIIKNVSMEEIKEKGQAARERAKKEFVPERWIEEILNDEGGI